MFERIHDIFTNFSNFPNSYPIVRNGIREDAYAIYTFEVLLSPYHGVKKFINSDSYHRELLTQSIVPPPDDSIDIFYEEKDLDERNYHIVQVKNSVLGQKEIETCFLQMTNSVKLYNKKPNEIHKNLRRIIAETDFNRIFEKNCTYYVVHKGELNFIRNQKKNQNIVTLKELQLLKEGTEIDSVPEESITIDTANNFIVNNFIEDNNDNIEESNITNKPKSLLCNFSGYDLARLNNSYSNTVLGRNILYGQNLRESLSTSSKTYESMFKTINREPELFLFYNNGITILASEVDAQTHRYKQENITLKKFSIINGAQTTSTLGAYLKEAEITGDEEKIDKLKKVHVLTKIYEINSNLSEHEKISENIKIFTNTQTPLSSRDMVSIRSEQIKLQSRFIHDCGYPNIFVFIKKGEKIPDYPKFLKHQQISNERLAQLCLAGFFREPYTAKDKKSKLFDYESNYEGNLNKQYDRIFNNESGILFKKNHKEVDELLFCFKLFTDTKKFHRDSLKKQLQDLNQLPAQSEVDKNTRERRISRVKRNLEIGNVFLFYCLATYYLFKEKFERHIECADEYIFDSMRYYNDKQFREIIIKQYYEFFFIPAVNVIRDNSANDNIQNWVRSRTNEQLFFDEMEDETINKEFKYSEEYIKFFETAKIRP